MADDKPANRKNGKTTPKAGATRADAAAETRVRSPQAKRDAVKATGKTSADRRAALREQQLREQQRARRNKQLKVAALIAALAVLIAAIAFGVWWLNRPKESATPRHTAANNTTITLFADKAKPGARTVTLYQDYQCPACKSFEDHYGQQLIDLAKNGDIKLQVHTLTFLDSNPNIVAGNAAAGTPKSSLRAATAAACVDATSDNFLQYFQTVYANQPAKEGNGYSDSTLRNDFAAKAGLTGDDLAKFQKCYDDKATQSFVTNADTTGEKELSALYPQGQFSTPSVTVDGKLMNMDTVMSTDALSKPADPNAMRAAIDATK